MTPADQPLWLTDLITRATAVDGQPPFSDQTLVELRDGRRELLALEDKAAAVLLRGTPGEAELVVDPDARRQGLGETLLTVILAESPELLIWAHGDHPAARALAASHGLTAVRTLLQLRAPVAEPADAAAALDGFSSFQPGDRKSVV